MVILYNIIYITIIIGVIMKLICDGLDLSDAVLKVSKAIGVKKSNAILEGIHLIAKGDTLTLIATDLELSIERVIRADVMMEGEAVVNGKYFSDFVKKLEKEQIELSCLDGALLKIKYSDSESEIQVFNAEEFPKINKDFNENYFVINQKEFKNIIAKTVFACSQDDSRPILKGCLFEIENNKLTSVALDGFRMAVCKKDISSYSGDFKAIIPARTLMEISRLLEKDDEDIKVVLQKNNLMIEADNTTLISRLLEGEFIAYKQIIPTEFITNARVNTSMLLSSIERASILARTDRLSVVKFEIKEEYLNVSSRSEIGNVNENIVINMDGKDVTIAFNSKYILEFLKILDDEFITLYLNSAIAPCVIKPFEGDEFLYLVLPVRINA